jgi:GAF domain-containing protein
MASRDVFLEALRNFANDLTSRSNPTDVVDALAVTASRLLAAAAAGVTLVDADGVPSFGSASSEAAGVLERAQQSSSQGPCHDVIRLRIPVLVDDLSVRSDWAVYRDQAEAVRIRSVMGIPLATETASLGALDVYGEAPRPWTPDDVAIGMVLADLTTMALAYNAQLAEAKRLSEQLQTALDSRILIEQAKGLLAGELGIDIDASFGLLRSHARATRTSLNDLARAVVEDGLRPDSSAAD